MSEMKRLCSGRRHLDVVADLLQPADEAVGGLLGVGAIEVGGTQVVPFGAVAQHVPGGGEHGGGHADDGLLGATACTQAVELGLQVAAFDLDGCPGGLHEGGLEPLAAAAQPGAATLAGALVVARAQARPGQQVCGRSEARHVDADLGDDDGCGDLAQPGHGAQQRGGLSKRLEPEAHLLLDLRDGLVQRVDVVQVQLEHEAVMRGDAPAQGLEDVLATGLDAAHAAGEVCRVMVPVDEGLQHGSAALAHDVGEHHAQLEVGVLQHLVDAQDMRAALTHELLARARERRAVPAPPPVARSWRGSAHGPASRPATSRRSRRSCDRVRS